MFYHIPCLSQMDWILSQMWRGGLVGKRAIVESVAVESKSGLWRVILLFIICEVTII